jgi:hypothetical protein
MKIPRILQSSTIQNGFPNGIEQNGKYTSDAQKKVTQFISPTFVL